MTSQHRSDQIRDGKPLIASKPSVVEFNVITKCSAGCIMCGYTDNGEVLSFGRFRRAADELLPTAREALLIGGEVMQHPSFYEICEYVWRFGVKLGMTTNLYTLAGRRAEAVRRFLSIMRVSIDAATKRTYESIRTNLDFERLVGNLYDLVEVMNDNSNLELNWYFVAMRRNIEELPLAVEMTHSFGFRAITVNFVMVYPPLPMDESLILHRDPANKYFDQARERASELGITIKLPHNFDLEHIPHLKPIPPTQDHILCERPWEHSRISLKGNVAPCCHLQNVPMGNIYQENFDQIWNGPKFQALRQSIKTRNREMPPRCRGCQLPAKQSDSNNLMLHIGVKHVSELQERLGLLAQE